jgi:pimeloyl-ACP methyl ester carboxylesterase
MTTAEMSMHETAETQVVDVGGVWLAFRRFGAPGAMPLLMLQHFRGNLDNWDPALTDALAGGREVILVDYPGVGASSGHFGPSIADTARRMIAFAETLGLAQVDLLGFSIGRFVAQEIALIRPGLVRHLVLAATGPKGGPAMHRWREDIAAAARLDESTAESLLHISLHRPRRAAPRASSSSGASMPAARAAIRPPRSRRATPSTTRSSSGASPTMLRFSASPPSRAPR